jgi:hypothetical protein
VAHCKINTAFVLAIRSLILLWQSDFIRCRFVRSDDFGAASNEGDSPAGISMPEMV